jgi:hypothetical protein
VAGSIEWALRTYVRRFGLFAGLTLLLVTPVTVATALFTDVRITGNVVGTAGSFLPLVFDDGPIWLLVLKVAGQLFLWPVYLVALNRAAVGIYLGERPRLPQMIRQGVRRWRSMLWISLLLAVVYLAVGAIVLALTLIVDELAGPEPAAWVGTILGLPLFVFFTTRLAFADVLLVSEGLRGRLAIGRSWLLTEGRVWPVLGTVLVASFFAIVANLALGTIAGAFTDATSAQPDLVLAIGVAAGQMVSTPLFVLAVAAIFFACLADDRSFDAARQLRFVHALDR